MTDISQAQDGFKAKSHRNPLWIPRTLTQNPAAFVEIDDIFDFSAAPSIVFRQYRIILSADTASEVRQMPSKSADNTGCIIEHFGNADAVPQLPERCLAARRELCGVAFSIAHTTIHSKCGVKQFVCPQSVFVGRGCQTRPALAYSVYGLQQADAAPIKANSGSNAAPGAF